MINQVKFEFALVISAFVLFAANPNVQRVSAQPTPRMEERGYVNTADESRVLIANTVGSTVSIIDTATQRVIRSIKVGEGSGDITSRSAGSARRQQ